MQNQTKSPEGYWKGNRRKKRAFPVISALASLSAEIFIISTEFVFGRKEEGAKKQEAQ